MNRHEKGLEFKVGIFVFAGLAMLGALVVQVGRLGEGFKTYYPLTIRFNDASGLLKGSDVLLAGARIGKVAGAPHLVREGNGVAVPLNRVGPQKLTTACTVLLKPSEPPLPSNSGRPEVTPMRAAR